MENLKYKRINDKTEEVYEGGELKGYIEHRGKGWYDCLNADAHYKGQGSSKRRATMLLVYGSI